jgi:trimeric autotransporter adhesin
VAVDLTPAAYFTRTGVSGTSQTQGGWFQLDAVPASFNSMFALDSGAPDWMGIYIDNDGGSARLNFWENSGGPVIGGPLVTLGEWYFVSVVRSGSTWTMYWRHEDDVALTNAGSGAVVGTVGTNLSLGKESVVDAATSFNGKMAYWRIHTSVLAEADVLAESESDAAVVAAWGDWPMNVNGSDVSGNARDVTASGTIVPFAAPDIGSTARPLPHLLDSFASGTDATSIISPSINPPAGSLIIIDVLSSAGADITPPTATGPCITGAAQVDSVQTNPSGTRRRLTRISATATGTAGAVTVTYSASQSGHCRLIHCLIDASVTQTQNGSSAVSGTALSTAALSAFGPDSVCLDVWASGANTAITPEAAAIEDADLGHTSPTNRIEGSWVYGSDTTPTATAGSSTWLGIASEVAALTGDGTATPAAIAAAVTVPATSVGAGVTTSSVDLAATLPSPTATGAGQASPVAIAVPVAAPAAAPSAGSTVSPAPVASSATLPAAGMTGGSPVLPVAIAATATLPQVSATGAGSVSPAAVSVAGSLPQASASGGALVSAAEIAAALSLPQPDVSGGVPVAPAVIAVVVAFPQASATGGDVLSPDPIMTSVALAAAGVSAGAGPSGITVEAVVPAASATGAAQATPTAIEAVLLLPAPALSAGATVTPAPIAAAVSVLAASIAAGAGPTAIATTAALPTAALSAGSTVTPAAIVLLALLPLADVVSDIEAIAVVGTYRESAINGYRETAARAWREP